MMDNETLRIIKYEGVLWIGVHVAISWIAYTQWFFVYIYNFIQFFMKKLHPGSASTTIVQDAKSLSKIPKHLAIILEKESGLGDIANVLIWSFLLGTPFVTVHHHKGFLESRFEELKQICEKKKSEFERCGLWINYHKGPDLPSDAGGGCHLMLSSSKDGRRKFAEVAESLCARVGQGTLATQNISNDLLTEKMQGHIPEPDLALSFSSYPCLHGFQPWNTRLTEIITLPSSNVSYDEFLSAVKNFANCSQRFGK